MDLVESVRLMAANELAVIDHWRGFVHHATATVLPRHGGRLVKSLGDGIMAEFDAPREAVSAALELHRYFDAANAQLPADQQLFVRAGLHSSHVYVDQLDIYGSGVNLAARVASLAGPGETMVTAHVRDGVVDGIDAQLEDMGECYLKHVERPVRAYRVGMPGPRPVIESASERLVDLRPTIAVMPFSARSPGAGGLCVGELIADGVIGQLSRTPRLRVIARLSATALHRENLSKPDAARLLDATYVLSGSYLVVGDSESGKVIITAVLCLADSSEHLWTDRFEVPVLDLCQVQSEACTRISSGVHQTILDEAALQATRQPPPTLASYSLLMSSISLMHRSTAADMNLSRRLLEHLAERHPRATDAHAWLAKSLVLNAVSRQSQHSEDRRRALFLCKEALERSPENALALAVHAHVCTHFESEPQRALSMIDAALKVNPNEALAWLFKSVLSSMWGDPQDAINEADQARRLSPLDPLAYYFKMIEAAAHTAAGDFQNGETMARDSLRLNRFHAPTWRVLITAQVNSGHSLAATGSVRSLLELDPGFTLDAYLAAGNADSRTKQQFAKAARQLGMR